MTAQFASAKHVVILNWKDTLHPAAGGAELYCHEVAKELRNRGYQVTLVAARPEGASGRGFIDDVRVRRLGRTFSVYPLALAWLWKHRHQIDAVIDSQNGIPFFSPAVLPPSTPVALVVHHVHQEQFGLYFSPVAAAVGRWLERTGSRWVYGKRPVAVVSPSSRSEVRVKLGLQGRVYVVPNGQRPVSSSAPRSRAAVPTITCVGRLVSHKRWDLLLRALPDVVAAVPGLRVNIVGTGTEEGDLRQLATRLGLDGALVFHGYTSAELRDELLEQSWLTVSTSRGEGWGLSVIEAAAQGVPAVAFDVPGLRDSVRHGSTGWLAAEAELPRVLGEALRVVGDADLAEAMAANCRAWAAQFTWQAAADRLCAILSEEALRQKLAHDGRTARSDTTAVVTLTRELAGQFDARVLRGTDQTTFCPVCLSRGPGRSASDGLWRLLLPGTDEFDARAVLRRGGVSPHDPEARVALARPADLLAWHGHASPHNVRDLSAALCPASDGGAARPIVADPGLDIPGVRS